MGKQQLSSLVGEWVMRSFRADKVFFLCCAWKDVLAMLLAKPLYSLGLVLEFVMVFGTRQNEWYEENYKS